MALYCPECSTSYSDPTLKVCPADGARLYRLEDETEDPLVGSVIDERFRIVEVIGRGGMGTVYRGVQLSISREVAIKVLRAELADREVALERFFREAKVISSLSHPNIVRLIDFGQDRDHDVLYLAMELVQGYNLAEIIRAGRLRVSVALDVLYQACGALTEPHAAGVIHRDLKPDNILLVPMSDGTIQAKVLDFGIARALEENTQITATGMICGTPSYMAPEQAQNDELDDRTDLYALGIIFYEALSGWPPFQGTSSLQIMLKHIREEPVPLRELLPPATIPEELEELTYALMTKDRQKRPASARAVRDSIDTLKKSLDLPPVHVEAGMSFDEIVEEWLLPKLPAGRNEASGPTEVLRRETGIENYLTSVDGPDSTAYVTDDSYPTIPLDTPNHQAPTDIDQPKSTAQGAQQGWTPGDQDAVVRIKQANDAPQNVDVHADTVAPTPPASRQTMLETPEPGPSVSERAAQLDAGPSAASSAKLEVKSRTESTDVGRPAADSTVEASRSSLSLSSASITVLNVILGFAAIAAAGAVIYMVRDTTNKPAPPKNQPVEVASISAEPGSTDNDEPAPKALSNSISIATDLAQNRVSIATREADLQGREAAVERAKTHVARPQPKAERPVKPVNRAKPESKPAAETTPENSSDAENSDDLREEDIFQHLRDP